MKKFTFRNGLYSTNKHCAKAVLAVITITLSQMISGCDVKVQDIEETAPKVLGNQHLEELSPKLTTHYLQPMFTVEALGYTAVDETGVDWLGSDEIYAIWQSNAVASTLIVDDVDSGDSIEFHPLQKCIYPIAGNNVVIDGRYGGEGSGWVCKSEGAPGPIQFTAIFLDDDSVFSNLPFCFSGSLVSDCEDSFVGKFEGSWTTGELVEELPVPGAIKDFSVRLFPCPNGPCGDDDFPDYDFRFRIIRMPNKEILMVNAID